MRFAAMWIRREVGGECVHWFWLKWNCFVLWPFVRFQQKLQKRASRTSAHIYRHLVYHIDLVFVSFASLFHFASQNIEHISLAALPLAFLLFYHSRHSILSVCIVPRTCCVCMPCAQALLFSFFVVSSARIWTVSRSMIYGTVHKPWKI